MKLAVTLESVAIAASDANQHGEVEAAEGE